jgi:hypothetical protein
MTIVFVVSLEIIEVEPSDAVVVVVAEAVGHWVSENKIIVSVRSPVWMLVAARMN